MYRIQKGEVYEDLKLSQSMNKLIEFSEELYKQIDNAQVHLINARLNNDEEDKKSAISEIETAMCNAMQQLKCLIDRKDNIVDLSEVWHTLDLKSKYDVDIAYLDIVAIVDNDIIRDINTLSGLYEWLRYNSVIQGQIKWAFWKDLLPKGGE